MIELTSCGDLKDNVDVIGVIKETVHFDDVRMVKEGLYFQLSDELIGYFLLNK